MAIIAHGLEFLAIEVVVRRAASSKEEPIASTGAERAPLMQESTEGRNACAGADHDDGSIGVLRQTEPLVGLDVDRQTIRNRGAIRKECGAATAPGSASGRAGTWRTSSLK